MQVLCKSSLPQGGDRHREVRKRVLEVGSDLNFEGWVNRQGPERQKWREQDPANANAFLGIFLLVHFAE